MSEAEELSRRFEELILFIDNADNKVESGTMPELGSLDKDIADLCRDVEDADSEAANAVQPLMAQMISKLDKLAQSLTEYQNREKERSEDGVPKAKKK